MNTIRRTGLVVAVFFSLLLAAGCSQPAKRLTVDLGNGVTMEFVRIEAGTFMMGSSATEKNREDDEGPPREVTITESFYMGVTEVTQEQYQAVMGKNPSSFTGAQRPVEQVSWDDATAFCGKLSQETGRGVRLPTEAEWEYACRAGRSTSFSFGDSYTELDNHAWCKGNAGGQTHPVGAKKPNAWGLYDMHGNVYEWCSDRYVDSYANADTRDPKAPLAGPYHVVRGGAWSYPPQGCRAADRMYDSAGDSHDNGGFRVVVESGPA